jgi:hypothetical protein
VIIIFCFYASKKFFMYWDFFDPKCPTAPLHGDTTATLGQQICAVKLFMPRRLTGAMEAKFIWFLTPTRTHCTGDLVGVVGKRNIRLCRETNPCHTSSTRITSSHSTASLYVNNHNHHYQSTSAGRYVSEAKINTSTRRLVRQVESSVHNVTTAWRNCERRTPVSALITLDS